MPQVKTLRSRGVNLVVSAFGELLFMPSGPVNQWTRKVTRRTKALVAQEAPSNRRPRWMHYGLPLKRTIRGTSSVDPATMRAHIAVGSTAHYAAYVDQGTGEYAGRSAYEVSLLPPWNPAFRYYEKAPWRPKVLSRGQAAQEFFDKGLTKALRSVGVVTTEIPGEPPGNPLRTFPDHLLGFLGNTPWSFAFETQRNLWRAGLEKWRDEDRRAGAARNWVLRRRNRLSPEQQKEQDRRNAALRQARWRSRNPRAVDERNRKRRDARKRISKEREVRASSANRSAIEAERRRFMGRVVTNWPSERGFRVSSPVWRDGRWWVTIHGGHLPPEGKTVMGRKIE